MFKVGHTSRSGIGGKIIMVPCERSCNQEYTRAKKSPLSSSKKGMAKAKVVWKKVKLQGQGHEVKPYGTKWKVLSLSNTLVQYESPISYC